MKKMIGTLAIALVLVFLTGCETKVNEPAIDDKKDDSNNSTITCTKTEKTSSYEVTGEIKGNFENKKLSEFKTNTTTTYNDQESLDDAYNLATFSTAMMNTESGITAKVEKDEMKIILTIDYNINEMNEATIKDMFDSETSSIDMESLKTYASESGFTCK